jgi:glycosylphosphatidylinositol transamidase (GPIT) subunit GPI8
MTIFSILFIISVVYLFLYFIINFYYEIDNKKINTLMTILMILSFAYLISYPPIYTIQAKNNKNILTEEFNQNLSQVKPAPIDEEMQKLIDAKIQREASQIKLDANAKQAYQNAKDYLNSHYRNTSISIISFIFNDQYQYTYNDGKYIITFAVIINLQNNSFLNKRFYFYMTEDDTQPMDRVWKILDYEEENIS